MDVSVAIEGFRHTFGEGPHWVYTTKQLLSVDYLGKTVHRWSASTGLLEQRQLPGKLVTLTFSQIDISSVLRAF